MDASKRHILSEVKRALRSSPLAKRWIVDRLESYEERPRKGIPRSQPRPFPFHKHAAACLQVFHGGGLQWTLEHLAKLVDVSDNQIRVWRTEDRFKGAQARELGSLAHFYIEELLKLDSVKAASAWEEYLNYSFDARLSILYQAYGLYQMYQELQSREENEGDEYFEKLERCLFRLVSDMIRHTDYNEEEFWQLMWCAEGLNTWHLEEARKGIEKGDSSKAHYHLDRLGELADIWLNKLEEVKQPEGSPGNRPFSKVLENVGPLN